MRQKIVADRQIDWHTKVNQYTPPPLLRKEGQLWSVKEIFDNDHQILVFLYNFSSILYYFLGGKLTDPLLMR